MRRVLLPVACFGAGVLSMLLVNYYNSGPEQKKASSVSTKNVQTVSQNESVVLACTDRKYTILPEDRARGLWGIAEKEYGGRGYLNLLIAERNNKQYPTLTENPNLIQVGWVLTISCCLCDLPALVNSPVVKKVTPKPTSVNVITPKPSPCPQCPKLALPTPCPECSKPVAQEPKASSPEAPKPPPVPEAKKQTQSQTVVVNAAPPQPAVVQPPAPKVETVVPKETKVFIPPSPPAKQVTEVIKPPTIELPKPQHLFVGSAWNTFGQNPIEPGNFVNYSHIEAGYIIGSVGKFQIEPYVALNSVNDTRGYFWNNRVQGEGGLKVVRPFSHGVVEFGGAYAAERRFLNNGLPTQTKTGPIGFTNGWLGWHQPTARESRRKFLTGALPGTVQWRVGNISPFERNNLIGVARFDQGFTLAKVGRVSIIPTGSFQLGFDTDKNPWNNRYTYGGGLKVAIPWKSGVLDFRGEYQCATQYAGVAMAGGSRCGPGFSVNVWTGGRHKKGGE